MTKEIKAILLTILTLILIVLIPLATGSFVPIKIVKETLFTMWLKGALGISVLILFLMIIHLLYKSFRDSFEEE